MPYLGAHMSIAGGLENAFTHIKKVGGTALQIFTKNQRQWKTSPLSPEEISRFQTARESWGNYPIGAHDSYLINLASPKEETSTKSIAAFADELLRAELLEIPFLIMHPGAHLGEGIENGLKRFVSNLDNAIMQAGEAAAVMVLIETTAGQGSSLGSDFAEIGFILKHSRFPERLGVCFDTCHSFTAGYDIRSPETYAATMADFDKHIGLDYLKFFHLNDSKKGLGSRVDRHEHIGKGKIGLEGFRNLMNDPRFADHPMTLETPKEKDLKEDIENLRILKGLIA